MAVCMNLPRSATRSARRRVSECGVTAIGASTVKTPDPYREKRERLAGAMKRANRWHSGYEDEIRRMPEPVLDGLLRFYVGDGSPIRVG